MSEADSRRPAITTDSIKPEPVLPDGEAEIERENEGDENIEPNRRPNPPVFAQENAQSPNDVNEEIAE